MDLASRGAYHRHPCPGHLGDRNPAACRLTGKRNSGTRQVGWVVEKRGGWWAGGRHHILGQPRVVVEGDKGKGVGEEMRMGCVVD